MGESSPNETSKDCEPYPASDLERYRPYIASNSVRVFNATRSNLIAKCTGKLLSMTHPKSFDFAGDVAIVTGAGSRMPGECDGPNQQVTRC